MIYRVCIYVTCTGVTMEPHSKQLHVSLAYQFVPDVRDHLELLARKIDLKAPARWDLRLYSRDQRIAHCQVRWNLRLYSRDQRIAHCQVRWNLRLYSRDQRIAHCQVRWNLRLYSRDQRIAHCQVRWNLRLYSRDQRIAHCQVTWDLHLYSRDQRIAHCQVRPVTDHNLTLTLISSDTFRKSHFHVSYHRRTPGTLARQRPGIGDACQSGKMATLLNSLFFVFKISLLPNYLVKYYDYIVKWCSGVEYNWCISLYMGLILALTTTFSTVSYLIFLGLYTAILH